MGTQPVQCLKIFISYIFIEDYFIGEEGGRGHVFDATLYVLIKIE